jgi:hypothetical protein
MSTITISELGKIAGGLNIEGGIPSIQLLADNLGTNTDQTRYWANLIVVLDRPILDNVLFDDLFKNNPYPLLENAVSNLDERLFLSVFVTTILYYLKNAPALTKKYKSRIKITIHIHQDIKSKYLVHLLDTYLADLLQNPNIIIDTSNIVIEYRTDDHTYTSNNFYIVDPTDLDDPILIKESQNKYADTDILISLSQCAGLAEKYKPGQVLLVDNFIPYDIKTNQIILSKKYTVPNHIYDKLEKVLDPKLSSIVVDYINKNYTSPNPEKASFAPLDSISPNDIKLTNILHVKELWNPTSGSDVVSIV